MSDLIKRLRSKCKMLHQCVDMRREAADRIEKFESIIITEIPAEATQGKFVDWSKVPGFEDET